MNNGVEHRNFIKWFIWFTSINYQKFYIKELTINPWMTNTNIGM